MSDKQPKVVTQITVSLLEDGGIAIHSEADLSQRIYMLKKALQHDEYIALILLSKDEKGIPVS